MIAETCVLNFFRVVEKHILLHEEKYAKCSSLTCNKTKSYVTLNQRTCLREHACNTGTRTRYLRFASADISSTNPI